jgi:integrase/recombinase XerC
MVMSDGGLVADYVTWMQAAGRGELTVAQRARQAERLCAVLDPATCTVVDLLGYLARQDWAPATRAGERAGVRSFLGWCQRAGVRPDDPSRSLPAVRVPPPCPHPAPEVALARARELAATPWERCMVELAALAGLRRAEIATLRFSDVVDTDTGPILRVTGKGRRTREVPIPRALADQVRALEPEYVFPGRSPGTHMGVNHCGEVLSRLLGSAATAHSLRHRYATRAYSRSHDLLAVQQLLGHSTPTTTQGYVRLDPGDLRRAAGAA